MSFRAGLRFFNAFRQQAAHTGKPMAQRSAYSSAAGTNASIPGPPQSRLQQLWSSPVGPKTVHFWAPIMKWGLVLAGAADFARPVESLSLSQNGALMATGLIWTRWCFVIKPRNLLYVYSTCSLNFCVVKVLTVSIVALLPSTSCSSALAQHKSRVFFSGKRPKRVIPSPRNSRRLASRRVESSRPSQRTPRVPTRTPRRFEHPSSTLPITLL
jgi:hypothetical protein